MCPALSHCFTLTLISIITYLSSAPLFNHLLFILPLWHAMHTHACAHTHTCAQTHTYTAHQHNSFHPNPHNICLSPLESAVCYTLICCCLIFMFSKSHWRTNGVYISSTLYCFTPLVNILFMLSLLSSVALPFFRFNQPEVTSWGQTQDNTGSPHTPQIRQVRLGESSG